MSESLVQAWTRARRRLEAAGVEGPVIDARLLLEAAAGASRTDILTDPHRKLSAEQLSTLDGYLERRAAREPVSHILGRKGFWTIELKVTPDVLTPRPDTEALVGGISKALPEGQAADILDLGVGSGAILLAILTERPLAHGVGVDISLQALEVARENAALLKLDDRAVFLHAQWAQDQPDDAFDVVVSNPPYIRTGDIAGLEPEVAEREPRLALDGGPDGLDAYRTLAPQILRVLKPGGLFALEIGHDQGQAVRTLMTQAGGEAIDVAGDLGGRDRAVFGRKPA